MLRWISFLNLLSLVHYLTSHYSKPLGKDEVLVLMLKLYFFHYYLKDMWSFNNYFFKNKVCNLFLTTVTFWKKIWTEIEIILSFRWVSNSPYTMCCIDRSTKSCVSFLVAYDLWQCLLNFKVHQDHKHLVKNADYGLIDLGWRKTQGISNHLLGVVMLPVHQPYLEGQGSLARGNVPSNSGDKLNK